MKLTLIIVNYKTPQLVLDCLQSIYTFDTNHIECIVVDNDSKDETEQLLRQYYPQVRFIQMGYNAGFARANNAGIRESSGDTVLLLNSDTINLHNAVNLCYERLSGDNCIAAGVQLLNEDGSLQISGNYAMKAGLNYLLPLPALGPVFRFFAGLLKIKKTHVANAPRNIEVDWINGAFLMVKKEAIEKAGLLDEDFFLYFEEAEWCSRLRKAGKLCIYGDLHVTHLQGASANEAFKSGGQGYYNLTDKKGYQLMLSCFLRIRKEFGIASMIFLFAFYLLEILFFLPLSLISSRYTFNNWKGYTKNIFAVAGFLPRITRNKPYFYKVL